MTHNEYRDQLAYDIQVEYDSDENGYPFVRDEEWDLAELHNLNETCDFCNGKAEFDLNDRDNCKRCIIEFIKDAGEGDSSWVGSEDYKRAQIEQNTEYPLAVLGYSSRMPTDEIEYPQPTPEMKKWFDENVIPDSSDDEVDILLDKLPELPKEAIAEMNKLFNVK